jgi:molecular chaperone DnaK (HSP70)
MSRSPEYIIGFDLGDGESSIAFTSVRTSDEKPRLFEMEPGRVSHVTAISRGMKGKVFIGEEAFKRGARELYVRFKDDPFIDPDWNSNKHDILMFAEEFFRRLLEQNPQLENNILCLYLGRPSAWSYQGVEMYKDHFKGRFPALKVVAESRAAFIYARENGISKNDLRNSVLVIDIGSSTTDFTYVRGSNCEELLENEGYPSLGAGEIDEEIFRRVLETHSNRAELENKFDQDVALYTRCHYVCRKAKEQYFTELKAKHPNPRGTASDPLIEEFQPILDKQNMDEILNTPLKVFNNRSWYGYYEYLLMEVKRLKGIPKVILLTGGGSHMPFTKDVCRKVFDEKDVNGKFRSQILEDENPSVCVSSGLAYLGRFDLNDEKFRGSLEDFCTSEEMTELIADHLFAYIDEVKIPLSRAMLEHALKPFVSELHKGTVSTQDIDVRDYLHKKLAAWLQTPRGKEILQPAIEQFTRQIEPELSREVEEICEKHGIPSGSLRFEPSLSKSFGKPEGWYELLNAMLMNIVVQICDAAIPQELRDIVPGWLVNVYMNASNSIYMFLLENAEFLVSNSSVLPKIEVSEALIEEVREQIRFQLEEWADEAAVYLPK